MATAITIDRDRVLRVLRDKREHIEREYGLRMIGIVGSVARGDATEESDIDVWVDMLRTPTLFQLVGAENEVSDALGAGQRVEFVLRENLRQGVRERMARDLVQL
ncbi:MAG: nucleotidyltransferase family protein [Propylenella sp.]